MKLLSWKTGIVVSFALCFVVFGTVIVSCQKPAVVQPQPKRYPHEHLQMPALEPNAQLHTVDYKLRDGETLANTARLRYGHQNYYRVIKLQTSSQTNTRSRQITRYACPRCRSYSRKRASTK
jgi:hypothetical protein